MVLREPQPDGDRRADAAGRRHPGGAQHAAGGHPRHLPHPGHHQDLLPRAGAAGGAGSGDLSAGDHPAVGAGRARGARLFDVRRLLRLRHLQGRHQHLPGAQPGAAVSQPGAIQTAARGDAGAGAGQLGGGLGLHVRPDRYRRHAGPEPAHHLAELVPQVPVAGHSGRGRGRHRRRHGEGIPGGGEPAGPAGLQPHPAPSGGCHPRRQRRDQRLGGRSRRSQLYGAHHRLYPLLAGSGERAAGGARRSAADAQRRRPRAVRAGAAQQRRRPQRRGRGGRRHRDDEPGLERRCHHPSGRGQDPRHPALAAARGEDRHHLQPGAADPARHPHPHREAAGRVADRRPGVVPVPAARALGAGGHRVAAAGHPRRLPGDVGAGHSGQHHVPGGHRHRHRRDDRRRDRDDREHAQAYGAGSRRRSLDEGAGGGIGSRAGAVFFAADHRGVVPAGVRARRRGGQAVSAPGLHQDLCHGRGRHPVHHPGAATDGVVHSRAYPPGGEEPLEPGADLALPPLDPRRAAGSLGGHRAGLRRRGQPVFPLEASRLGVHAALERRHPALHAGVAGSVDLHRPIRRDPAAERPHHQDLPRSGERVRQGGPGADSDRPDADLDVHDRREPQRPQHLAGRHDHRQADREDESGAADSGGVEHLDPADQGPGGHADHRPADAARDQGHRRRSRHPEPAGAGDPGGAAKSARHPERLCGAGHRRALHRGRHQPARRRALRAFGGGREPPGRDRHRRTDTDHRRQRPGALPRQPALSARTAPVPGHADGKPHRHARGQPDSAGAGGHAAHRGRPAHAHQRQQPPEFLGVHRPQTRHQHRRLRRRGASGPGTEGSSAARFHARLGRAVPGAGAGRAAPEDRRAGGDRPDRALAVFQLQEHHRGRHHPADPAAVAGGRILVRRLAGLQAVGGGGRGLHRHRRGGLRVRRGHAAVSRRGAGAAQGSRRAQHLGRSQANGGRGHLAAAAAHGDDPDHGGRRPAAHHVQRRRRCRRDEAHRRAHGGGHADGCLAGAAGDSGGLRPVAEAAPGAGLRPGTAGCLVECKQELIMQRRSFVTVIVGLVGTVSGYLLGRRPAQAQGNGMMGGGMMGGGMMGGMMSPENMRGPMRTGMELFERHKLIRRQVTELPDGVHDVTTSADPTTAALIKEHVIDMYRRLDEDRPFPYPMSNSVPQMFANPTKYQRKLDILPDGVAVTETSSDPEMVAVIKAHARELDRFAKDGMPAMMRGMM